MKAGIWTTQFQTTDTSGGQPSYTYDSDVTGATVWYEYDSNNHPTRIKSGAGTGGDTELFQLGYSAQGLLTHLVTTGGCLACGGGSEAYYDYDASSRLTKVRDANQTVVVTKEYDYAQPASPLTKISAEADGAPHNRWSALYDYDYTQKTYGSFAVTKLDYVNNTSARVRVEEYSSSWFGVPTKIREYSALNANAGGAGFETTYMLEFENGRPESRCEISPRGVTRIASYDTSPGDVSFGHVIQRSVKFGTEEKTVGRYEYTVDGMNLTRVSKEIDDRGGTREYRYGSQEIGAGLSIHGLLTQQIEPSANGNQQTYNYAYDNNRLVTREWRKITPESCITTAYYYDHCDNLTQTIEAYGTPQQAATLYQYDMFNHQTRVRDPRGYEQVKLYTPGGALVSEYALAHQNPGSNATALSQTTYAYDLNGRMTMKCVADDDGPFTVDSPAGGWITTLYHYDAFGRKEKVTEDSGGLNLETTYEYNNQDEVTKTTTPGDVWTETVRDGRGLVVTQYVGYSSTTAQSTTYEYDADGNLTRTVNPRQQVTTYEYNGYGQKTKMIQG